MSEYHIYLLKWLAVLIVGFGCLVSFHAYVLVQLDLKMKAEADHRRIDITER